MSYVVIPCHIVRGISVDDLESLVVAVDMNEAQMQNAFQQFVRFVSEDTVIEWIGSTGADQRAEIAQLNERLENAHRTIEILANSAIEQIPGAKK